MSTVAPVAKRCPTCGQMKTIDQFGVDRSRADGLNYWCRPCRTTAQKARNTARKAHRAEQVARDRRCHACRAKAHGPDCEAGRCPCRCRPMLGLDGPFQSYGGDPTAPNVIDQGWVA